MLDKNIKYITIGDKIVHSGQDPRTGAWYCKDAPHELDDTKKVLTFLNQIYNEVNQMNKKKIETEKKKEKKNVG